jgi:hypothetical protein
MRASNPPLLVLFWLGFFGGAAAAQEAREMRLEDAGFVMRPANTAKQMERLKKLPPRKFVARTVDGKRFYLYADPDGCKCVMVGDQRALQAFRDMRPLPSQIPGVAAGGISPQNEMIADFDQDLGSDVEPDDILSHPF